MKEKAIKKINTIGKIGAIVAKIARICMIVGAAALLISGIILLCIPNDFLKITVNGKMGMEINVEKYFDEELDEENINKVIGEGFPDWGLPLTM